MSGPDPVFVPFGDGEILVHPGVINATAINLYLNGHCAPLALALAELGGLPVAVVRASVSIGRLARKDGRLVRTDDMVDWMHALAVLPDDQVLDVLGPQTEAAACARVQQAMPDYGPYRIERVSAEGLRAEVAPYFDLGGATRDLARSFATVLLGAAGIPLMGG